MKQVAPNSPELSCHLGPPESKSSTINPLCNQIHPELHTTAAMLYYALIYSILDTGALKNDGFLSSQRLPTLKFLQGPALSSNCQANLCLGWRHEPLILGRNLARKRLETRMRRGRFECNAKDNCQSRV